MRQIVGQLESDPAVKAMMDTKKSITDAMLDSAEQRGMTTTA